MVRIPYIKIPSVRVGSIVPTSNIGTGGATPAPPTPITYLTQWKIVGNSEVHTLPYPDGVVLPTGYKRCKYLGFNNTQYFETGIVSKQDIGARFRFSTTTENKWIFGVRNGATGDSSAWKSTFMFGYLTSNTIRMGYGGTMSSISSVNYADGNIHTVVLDSNVAKVDDANISINRDIIETSYNIPVGSIRTNGIIEPVYFVGCIYDFVLYDEEQTLFNGIPCLDANDVPCFYDIVSQTAFYNQGSGNFTYELYPQPTEIWSCGEYNATDGKWHILVQPQGGSVVDIALTEPLRKVNDIADTIEFPSSVEGKALVSRNLIRMLIGDSNIPLRLATNTSDVYRWVIATDAKIIPSSTLLVHNVLSSKYDAITANGTYICRQGVGIDSNGRVVIYDAEYTGSDDMENFKAANADVEVIYELDTPTTELVDAPQIEEADSYTCVISQGGKAVSWSSFETYSE